MKTDYKTIQVEIIDGVAVFTMNNPPVNQLSGQFRADLGQAFGEAYGDDAIQGVVLTGKGKNFIAGADITEIQHIVSRCQRLDQPAGLAHDEKARRHVPGAELAFPEAVVAARGHVGEIERRRARTADRFAAENDKALFQQRRAFRRFCGWLPNGSSWAPAHRNTPRLPKRYG